MTIEVDYDHLNDALRRAGSNWNAAQAHGLVSGKLAVLGDAAGADWISQVLDGAGDDSASSKECEELLASLLHSTQRRFRERLSEFELLLPDDSDPAGLRTEALAHWCEGYLHGLVSSEHGDALKKRLAEDPLADIIRDMLQITRAAVDEDSDDEESDAAFHEVAEYLRVAAQLAYEELAALRPGQLQ